MYIIKIQSYTTFTNKPYVHYIYKDTPKDKPYITTENINHAHHFTFEEKNSFLENHTLEGTVIVMSVQRKYRIKVNGHYVKDNGKEYLDECTKEESIFSADFAQALHKQCPLKIELEEIR